MDSNVGARTSMFLKSPNIFISIRGQIKATQRHVAKRAIFERRDSSKGFNPERVSNTKESFNDDELSMMLIELLLKDPSIFAFNYRT